MGHVAQNSRGKYGKLCQCMGVACNPTHSYVFHQRFLYFVLCNVSFFLATQGAQNKWRKSMLKQMTAFCCVHQCRFPYLYGPCDISFPICLANCLPASTGIRHRLLFWQCVGQGGPNCGQEVFPFWTGETGSGWSGRFVPVVARTLVPVVLGRQAPVGPGDRSRSWWRESSRLCQADSSRSG